MAVFSTPPGYPAHPEGLHFNKVVKDGIELAFITYPAVNSQMPAFQRENKFIIREKHHSTEETAEH